MKMNFIRSLIRVLVPSFIKKPLKSYYKSRGTIRKAKKLLKSNNTIKLEIGSGPKTGTNGWATMDLCDGCDLYWDLNNKIPFPDNSLEMIYSSHVMEHFPYQDLVKMLSDCFRMLKSGGVYSACVPNARIFVEGYNNPEKFDKNFLSYKPGIISELKMDFLNYIFYLDGQHKYMFDEENLTNLLKKIGFVSVELRDFDPSLDLAERKHESLFVQGKKP